MASPTAPVISATGISAPNYAAILDYLQTQYQAIYGADAYLGNDSQDGQLLGVFAQAIADANAAAVAVYNAFSPATAQGAGLSSVVKINGLARLAGSFSTAQATITGTAGTSIVNGAVTDQSNNTWLLPAAVTIPNGGSVQVTVTAEALGPTGTPSAFTIATPTYGWQAVSYVGTSYVAGSSVEADAALRGRQANSTSLPALTISDAILAAVQATTGVARAVAYENTTSTTNSNGIPAHALALVVESGAALSIATAINSKLPPGGVTFGSTSVSVTDSLGVVRNINYSAPTESTVNLTLSIHALTNGWSTAAEAVIAANLAAYLSSLPIGQPVSYTALFGVAYNVGAPYQGTFNITALTMGKNGGNQSPSDLAIAWNEAPVGNAGTIAFNIV